MESDRSQAGCFRARRAPCGLSTGVGEAGADHFGCGALGPVGCHNLLLERSLRRRVRLPDQLAECDPVGPLRRSHVAVEL